MGGKIAKGDFQREEREVSNESRPQPAPPPAERGLSQKSPP